MHIMKHADETAMLTTQHARIGKACQAAEPSESPRRVPSFKDRPRVDALFLETRKRWRPLDIVRADYALRCARLTRQPVVWWLTQSDADLTLAAANFFPQIIIVTAAVETTASWVSAVASFAARTWPRAAVAVLPWPGFAKSELGPSTLCLDGGVRWPRQLAEAADLVDV